MVNALKYIFTEIPDESFEEKNILDSLTTTFNYVIGKNEIDFLILNINNDELRYNFGYKYKSQQDFYFDIMKFTFNLPSYWMFFSNTQSTLRRLFLKEIMFSDDVITSEKQQLLNRIFNVNGNALSEFDFKLDHMKSKIKSNRITLKRAKLPELPKYREYEKNCLKLIDEIQREVKIVIEDNIESKKNLESEIKKRHGIISKESAKKILSDIPYIGKLFKD